MNLYIQIILILKHCLRLVAGDHFPNEITKLIMILYHQPTKVSCGHDNTIIVHNNIHYFGNNLLITKLIDCDGYYANADIVYQDEYNILRIHKGSKPILYGTTNRIQIEKKFRIKKMSCGSTHVMVIDSLDKLYAYGSNVFGQLGLGDKTNRDKLELVKLSDVISVNCGSNHTIALTKNHYVYAWGTNLYGRLGVGYNKKSISPTQVSLSDIIQIACGDAHTVVLSKSGKVFAWGRNKHGQLGIGYTEFPQYEPKELSLEHIVSINCGSNFTFAIDKYGDLYGWGSNIGGKLGFGKSKKRRIKFFPAKISLSAIMSVSCGADHTMVVNAYNEVYAWGFNRYGQLGLNDDKNQCFPCRIEL